MSNNIDDNTDDIKINIRTGTSTRRPIIREENNNEIPIISFEFYINNFMPNFQSDFNPLDIIIQRSLNDTELKRNCSIRLNLPSHKYKKSGDTESCSICQDIIKQNETVVKVQLCSHLFHKKCLQEWVKYSPICPVCRTAIPVLEK